MRAVGHATMPNPIFGPHGGQGCPTSLPAITAPTWADATYEHLVESTAARLAWDNYPIDACMVHAYSCWQQAGGDVVDFRRFVADVMAKLVRPVFERLEAGPRVPFWRTEALLWVEIGREVEAGNTVEVAGQQYTVYVIKHDHLGRRMGRLSPPAYKDGKPVIVCSARAAETYTTPDVPEAMIGRSSPKGRDHG